MAESQVTSATVRERLRGQPNWLGEAWHKDDGLVLNLPVFSACGQEFKRLLLRGIRFYEFSAAGRETWVDYDNDVVCTLETLPEDRLPPLLPNTMGQHFDHKEIICRGGDYDCRLVVVLKGTVHKLIGDTSTGGRVVTRTLARGDCEGLPEFLGVGGTQQRTCCLRAGPEGAHVRYVTRDAVLNILKETIPGKEEDDDPDPKYAEEVTHFNSLALDRIDALHHKAAPQILAWQPLPTLDRLEFMQVEGQTLFFIDNALGTSVSGPLPEGVEERYFLDGQTVIKSGVPGDSLIMVLRGEIEAKVPPGCAGQCLPRQYKADPGASGSWLGDGRDPSPMPENNDYTGPDEETLMMTQATHELNSAKEIAMVHLVRPPDIKRAVRKLTAAAETGKLDLSDQKTTDWRWSWSDPRALQAIEILKEHRLLSPNGEERADEIHLHQFPPQPPPPPSSQAILGSGTLIGHLALLGVPVVLSGVVRAKGPVHLIVLHRSVLLEALTGCPSRAFFEPNGVSSQETKDLLQRPKVRKGDPGARAAHLGPNTGPPMHMSSLEKAEPLAGSFKAFNAETGNYAGMPGADALNHVLLHAIQGYALLWDLVHDQPGRVIEALVASFEPRWLLPNEVVVVDEEPDADFLFVVIHGSLVVTLEGAEIDHIGQGNIQGAAQLFELNDWTRTITVELSSRSEAMIQVLRRSKLVKTLDARNPIPKGRLQDIEHTLRDAKKADWRLLQRIPAFGNAASKQLLTRIFKDADIVLFCPGDYLAEAGAEAPSMLVVLAGVVRSEQAQTLFFVELKRGDWCFQNNILGIEKDRAHDVVAVSHVMVMTLYRHALLNAIVAHPAARATVLENETWRTGPEVPKLGQLRLFEGVPEPVLARLHMEGQPRYYDKGSVILEKGEHVDDDMLLFIFRGEVRVSILGIETRRLGVGEAIGTHRYLGLDAPPSNAEIVAISQCDVLAVRRETMADALAEERYEDDLMPYKNATRALGGGEILDAFGLPLRGGPKYTPNCVEKSEVLRVCTEPFVKQIPTLVEEMAFWPGDQLFEQGGTGDFMFFIKAGRVRLEVFGRKKHEVVGGGAVVGDMACLEQIPFHTETAFAETYVWARVLHKQLLMRALSSFPEEERRLKGAARGGANGIFDDE